MTAEASILMIDDDECDVFSVKRALHKLGFNGSFSAISSGQKFLDVRETLKVKPNLILMDLNMPGISGFDAVAEIKADQAWHSVPIVMLTTSMQSADKARSIKVGASAFLTKPSSSHEMSTVMDQISQFVALA